MKKYFLYRKPINGPRGDWYFDDEFHSYEAAYAQAKENALNGSWKVWKIEEVLVFE